MLQGNDLKPASLPLRRWRSLESPVRTLQCNDRFPPSQPVTNPPRAIRRPDGRQGQPPEASWCHLWPFYELQQQRSPGSNPCLVTLWFSPQGFSYSRLSRKNRGIPRILRPKMEYCPSCGLVHGAAHCHLLRLARVQRRVLALIDPWVTVDSLSVRRCVSGLGLLDKLCCGPRLPNLQVLIPPPITPIENARTRQQSCTNARLPPCHNPAREVDWRNPELLPSWSNWSVELHSAGHTCRGALPPQAAKLQNKGLPVTVTLKQVKSSVARSAGIVLGWSSGYGAGD